MARRIVVIYFDLTFCCVNYDQHFLALHIFIYFHPAERALTSHWSANSFIMDVYEKARLAFSVQCTTNIFSQTTIIKRFTDQSEVGALPLVCTL